MQSGSLLHAEAAAALLLSSFCMPTAEDVEIAIPTLGEYAEKCKRTRRAKLFRSFLRLEFYSMLLRYFLTSSTSSP